MGQSYLFKFNPEELAAVEKLDGCYALRTDLSPTAASKQTIHDRYKDLALVEWAFRTSKTGHLEMRPLFLRREARTRGHAFVVELASMSKRYDSPTVFESLSSRIIEFLASPQACGTAWAPFAN